MDFIFKLASCVLISAAELLKRSGNTMKNVLKTILAVTAVISAGSVYAVPTLTIFDGTSTVTIMDNMAGDSNPAAGVVTWIGSIGLWNINVDSGFTKPAVGGVTNPHMDLSFSANSTSAGLLTLFFSDSGFNASGTGVDRIGGTQDNGYVTDCIQVNGKNVMVLGPLYGSPFSATTSGNITLTPTDLLALGVYIRHTGAGLTTGDKDFTVPDGGSAVALLGVALAGIEGVRRMFRARKS